MEKKQLSDDTDHLVIMLAKQLYALPYYDLVQVVDSPQVTKLPQMDAHVRGTIDFQGEVIVLYDLRTAIGLPSLAEEIALTVRSLAERKQDHINWIGRLKEDVYQDREISVQTDPHKCAFGQWYDHFHTESQILDEYMARFDAPHKKIHNLAVKAKELIAAGQKQEAKDLIHEAERTELDALIRLFDSAEHVIRTYTYEYAVVLENGEKKFAISVDSVKSFERIDAISHQIPPILKRTCGDYLRAFGRRKTDDEHKDVLILNADKLSVNLGSPL